MLSYRPTFKYLTRTLRRLCAPFTLAIVPRKNIYHTQSHTNNKHTTSAHLSPGRAIIIPRLQQQERCTWKLVMWKAARAYFSTATDSVLSFRLSIVLQTLRLVLTVLFVEKQKFFAYRPLDGCAIGNWHSKLSDRTTW